jgi:hypothetical protein
MLPTILFCFFSGLFGANGVPHFVKGITKENYPCLAGNTPIPNLIAGLLMIVLAIVLFHFAPIAQHETLALISGAGGALAIGLVHAGPGAIGKKDNHH